MFRSSLELMHQVSHSDEVTVGGFLALPKRCPEALQSFQPVLPMALESTPVYTLQMGK